MTTTATDPAVPMSNPSFWDPTVHDDITVRVKLDPRVATWLSLFDSRMLKELGFSSLAKYTLPDQRRICEKVKEVVDAIDDDGVLVSKYSQHGRPFDFHATKGRVAELPACIRSMVLKDFKDLDVASAQHRIHEMVTRCLCAALWQRYEWFWRDLKDPQTRQRLATALDCTVEEAKEHLNSIWNSFEPRRGVAKSGAYKEMERAAWQIRHELFEVPALRFARDAAEEKHKDDRKRVMGSFMSRVYAFVMNKTLLAVRAELGEESVVTLIHDGCHVDSTESNEAIVAKAERACLQLLGDPLRWSIKPPEFRVKVCGTKRFTACDISTRVNLDDYDEDAIEMPFEAYEEFVDPQLLAQKLGQTLMQIHATKMSKERREEMETEAREAAFRELNRRYKPVHDYYVDTQFDWPVSGFKTVAANTFAKVMKSTTVEYTLSSGARHEFNLGLKFEGWNKLERKDKICFHPKHTPERCLNTWTPFAAEEMPPLRREQRDEIAHRLVRLFRHIKYLSGERPYDFMMILLWVANMVQFPEYKSLCLVLLSEEGTGKSMFTNLLQLMIGKSKTLRTSSPENNVWGKFNGMMLGKFLVELAEISKANMHHYYEKVKTTLEDDFLNVECKGVDGFQIDSLHHYILNSNNLAAVPPGRRFLPVRCSDRYAAKLDCRQCAKLMMETNGETLMCGACVELGGYHAENHKAFDALCAKAFYEFCMALNDVPEKLTSTHVRENEATAHIREAAKDSIDVFLEQWVSSCFQDRFTPTDSAGAGASSDIVIVDPQALHTSYREFTRDDREPMELTAFQSRLGRKKLTSIAKKRVRIEGTTFQPYKYVVNVRKLIDELGIAGDSCGAKSVVKETAECDAKLERLKAERERKANAARKYIGSASDAAELRRLDEEITACEARQLQLAKTFDKRLADEVVQEPGMAAGDFVPKRWRDFYDDVEGEVDAILEELLKEEEEDGAAQEDPTAEEAEGVAARVVESDASQPTAKRPHAAEATPASKKAKVEVALVGEASEAWDRGYRNAAEDDALLEEYRQDKADGYIKPEVYTVIEENPTQYGKYADYWYADGVPKMARWRGQLRRLGAKNYARIGPDWSDAQKLLKYGF